MKKLMILLWFISILNLSATIINVPLDQSSIQAGIDVAIDADTVLVHPGIYLENINFNGKNITVASFFLTTQDTTYISQTVIDGNQNGSVVTFSNGESPTAILQGFQIINGNGTEENWSNIEPWFVCLGGGIYCNDSSPSLMNLVVSGNTIQLGTNLTAGYGVGIFSNNSTLHLNKVKIKNNIGSGYSVNGSGICFINSSPIMSDLLISNNSTDYGHGGGIYCKESNLNFTDIIVDNNSSNLDGQGGGIFCDDSFLQLQNAIISNNYAEDAGGGISCINYSNLYINNSIIISNSSDGSGGGIFSLSSNPILEVVEIYNNSSGSKGGGIFSGGSNSISSFNNVTISNNSAIHYGGGFYCMYQSSSNLTNVTINNNSSLYGKGGGISCVGSNLSIKNGAIYGNDASYGSGIWCEDNSNLSLTNASISENTASINGGGITIWDGAIVNLTNSILWANFPEEIYLRSLLQGVSTVFISYSDIQNGENGITDYNGIVNWQEGNIDEDPLFINSGEYPFMLQDISPCVNAGIPDTIGLNLPEYDLAGNPRIFGNRIDMGTYENQNVFVDTGDSTTPNIMILNQNYPNPFNPITTIDFSVQNNSKIDLTIFNIKGQKIKTLAQSDFAKGNHSFKWNGTDENGKSVCSGIYYYKLSVNEETHATKKCLLLK